MIVTVTVEDAPNTCHALSPAAIAADCEANRISINALGSRIDAVRARIDARFARIDDRFARLDTRFDRLEARFDRMDALLAEQGKMLNEIVAWVEEQPKAPEKRSAKK